MGRSLEDIEKLKKHKFFEGVNWSNIAKRKNGPVFTPSSKEVESYYYFPNYNEFGLNTEFATADEFDTAFNEASETPVLIREFPFF